MKDVEKFKELIAHYTIAVRGFDLEKVWELQENLIDMYLEE